MECVAHRGDAIVDRFMFLHVSCVDRVAVVSLDCRPVDALSQGVYGEIFELFGRIGELLPDCAAVILLADGRHFRAGDDQGELLGHPIQPSPGRRRLVRQAFAAIDDCPLPVIAVEYVSRNAPHPIVRRMSRTARTRAGAGSPHRVI